MDKGWRVAVLAATGPSFSEEQARLVREAQVAGVCNVIAINDNWQRLPDADVLYACDGDWWLVNAARVSSARFAGERWTVDEWAARSYDLNYVRRLDPSYRGLTKVEGAVVGGGSSGYQAINLAYLFGARTVLLVGYDHQRTGGKAHWFGAHPSPLSNASNYKAWDEYYRDLAADCPRAGLTVINCTRTTALTVFPRTPLEAALARLAEAAL